MVIELRVVQFGSEIILVISNRTRATRSFDFEITRMISGQIALHSVQLPLFMGTSDVLQVLKIARAVGRVQFENSQNITSAHKSRNARVSSYDFLFIMYSAKLLRHATLHAIRTM